MDNLESLSAVGRASVDSGGDAVLLRFEGRLTLGELVCAQLLSLRDPRRPRPIFMVLGLFIVAALVLAVVAPRPQTYENPVLPYIIGASVAAALLFLLAPFVNYWLSDKEPARVTVTLDELVIESKLGSSRLRVSALKKWRTTANMTLVYLTKYSFIVLTKRTLQGAGEFSELAAHLRSQLGDQQ